MPLMYQQESLQMEWCLDCHRAPEKNLRPRDQVRFEQISIDAALMLLEAQEAWLHSLV